MRPWPLKVMLEFMSIRPSSGPSSVYKHFIWRLVSVGMVTLSLDADVRVRSVFCLEKDWNATRCCGHENHQPTM